MHFLPEMTAIRCLKNSYGEFNEVLLIGPSIWPHFDLIHVREGEIELTLMDEHRLCLSSGQAILIYPQTHFRGSSLVESSRVSVHHFQTEPDRISNEKEGYETFLNAAPPGLAQDIYRAVRLAEEEPSPWIDELRAAVMVTILAQLVMASKQEPGTAQWDEQFRPLIAWLRENMDKPLRLADMADRVNCSVSHFRALFKARTGVGPGTYFLDMRMAEASRLLRETLMPIKEVAASVGYREVPHFYRAFASHHGAAPGRYREKHRPVA